MFAEDYRVASSMSSVLLFDILSPLHILK